MIAALALLLSAQAEPITLRLQEARGWEGVYSVTYTLDVQVDKRKADNPVDEAYYFVANQLTARGTLELWAERADPERIQYRRRLELTDVRGSGLLQKAADKYAQMLGGEQAVVIDPFGRTLSTEEPRSLGPSFPEEPIAEGAIWTAWIANGAQEGTVEARFVRVESLGGRQAARIEVSLPEWFEGPQGEPAVYWFSPTTGRLLGMRTVSRLEMPGRTLTRTFDLAMLPEVRD